MKIINIQKSKKQQTIQTAIKVLKADGLIIYPTETCYGVGVDATNQKAVDRVLEYKKRPEGKAIAIAVSDQEMAQQYVAVNETAKNIYKNFLPGPITVISKSKNKVAKGLEAEDKTLGIRIPNYPLVLKIIQKLDRPITTTSANVSYKKTPYSLDDILKNTTKKQQGLIDLFLDAGALPKNPPSTVVSTLFNQPQTIRQGEIKISEKSGQTFVSNSEKETQKIAGKILSNQQSAISNQSLIFALQGELGSGKTQFAKGLGKALGIKDNISSPTFVLAKEYPFRENTSEVAEWPPARWREKKVVFYHLDTWRLQEKKEVLEIGFEKMLKPGNIIAIEWAQKAKSLLEKLAKQNKALIVWVNIETLSPTKRKIIYD